MNKKLTIICSVILFLILFSNVKAQIEGQEKEVKFSESSRAGYDEIESNINKELGTIKNHKWAGSYYYGDGLGINVSISLAPKSGFIFTWSGCLGLYDRNYGRVEEKDGKIIFLPEHANKREGFQGIDTEFYPILWGKRHYLIPVGKMIKFINRINAGYEPRSKLSFGTSFAIKEQDKDKEVSGRPNIPSDFQEYLLRKPIEAKLLQVLESVIEDDKDYDSKTRTTVVTLNVGRLSGVKKGMEFYAFKPTDFYDSAEIIEVEESSSKAVITQTVYKDAASLMPAINWQLSTDAFRKHE